MQASFTTADPAEDATNVCAEEVPLGDLLGWEDVSGESSTVLVSNRRACWCGTGSGIISARV